MMKMNERVRLLSVLFIIVESGSFFACTKGKAPSNVGRTAILNSISLSVYQLVHFFCFASQTHSPSEDSDRFCVSGNHCVWAMIVLFRCCYFVVIVIYSFSCSFDFFYFVFFFCISIVVVVDREGHKSDVFEVMMNAGEQLHTYTFDLCIVCRVMNK